MRHRRRLQRALRPTLTSLILLLVGGVAKPPEPLKAQHDEGVRIGITVGGTSFAGISVEFLRDGRSLEVALGTWAARDLALSVVGREYFGASAAKPVVGLGMWLVLAFPDDGQTGIAVVARAPIGLDWNPGGEHFLALDLNVNRGLWVRRSDPLDLAPMNHRLVPLPGLAYRWRP